jgi:sulfur-carrier protein
VQINILIFGQLTDITGVGDFMLENIGDTNSLLAYLHAQYPALRHSKFVLAVNKQTVFENTILSDNSTIALLPAFSGG